MPLLWLLVILLVIFAIAGGVAINNFLWLVLVIALVVASYDPDLDPDGSCGHAIVDIVAAAVGERLKPQAS